MDKNLDNLTKLTEFAPLESEEKPQTVGQFFSKFFKFGKTVNDESSNRNSSIIVESTNSKNSPICDKSSDQSSNDVSSSNNSVQFSVDISEGRSLPNVLKRISNLLALKSSGLQAYGDTELRQYWMPDSVSKECYECCERFTTWRRRHHCRVCGQIFCSRCCSQEIPGKIMGCTGDLRVCTYCCKVVLSYLQSPDMGSDLTSDLRALQEDLQVKFGTHSSSIGITNYSDNSSLTVPLTFSNESNNGVNIGCNKSTNIDKSSLSRRKVSVGYQEEKFAEGRFPNSHSTPNEERCRALQSSTSLRSLYEDICKATICNSPGTINKSLSLGTHRYRLRTYPQCVQGSQLVDWLINHNKAASRIQATALGQALLEAGYLENVVESPASSVSNSSSPVSFSDSPTGLYRPCAPSELPFDPPTQDGLYNKQGAPHEPAEPSWVQQIPNDGGTTTDSEAESQPSVPMVSTGGRIPSSSSSFYLDLDLEANTVHLVRPTPESTMSDFLNNDVSNINIHISPKESDSASNVPPNSADREIVPASGWYNLQQLRADNGENEAYCALNEAWKQHENALMMQLLRSEGLSQNWASVIQPLIHEVVNFVRPDLNHDAELMDIREYVRVKTVPGGTTGNKGSESRVIRGIVCSKNVAHRSMQGQRKQPRILLLACPLVYQRNEGRFMSLEPVLMQEHEYLRHATARILALHPNVVLVGRNASRLAQQLLGESGVALATAVKHSVLERLARVSSADIVTSVDASSIGRPWKLATCQEFYTQQFRDDNNGSKTLMFFEGLPNPHLGCTILLRGASKSELKKLKRVTQHLLFARYNWRLEQSFLMDEFAKPPCPKKDTFFGDHLSSKESTPEETVNKCKKINTVEKNSTEIIISDDNIWIHTENDDTQKNVNITENNNSFTVLTDNKFNNNDKKIIISDNIKDEAEKNIKSLNPSNSLQNNINNITKSSVVIDPLQYYEDGIFNNTQQLDVSEAPLSNRFRKALDDTILSISPYLNFNIPFLETEIGRKCKLRKFFPREIYYSLQFLDTIEKTGVVKCITSNDSIEEKNNNIKLKPAHPFISAKLTSAADSKEVQTMLAHFRACGGRIPHQNINETKSFKHTKHSETEADNSNSKNISVDLRDALDFNNHQRLAVLFCSFSYSSNNAPAFCVNPWIVHMDFYGRNDIALGCFLERYCFRESYVCPSHTCETPMLQHIRRFVHHNGCVHVTLNKLENLVPSEDNKIVMWSWCSKCNTVSSVVPMSNDTWSFSFAKFLELKFHGHMYGRRGKNETCTHSLHHDYCQYFGWKHIVASFKYTPVQLWEISLPSPCLEFHWNPVVQQEMVIDEVKTLALRGHEVYSAILDKLLFYNELEEVPALKLQLQRDQADFKLLIEEAQLKLTSPTLENKKQECSDSTGIHYMIWCLEDSLVRIKHLIAEACETWNAHISELIQIQTKLTKLNKSLSKQNTQSKIDNSISNNPNKPLILHIADDTDVTDIDSPSSPDYNAVDVANASNSVIENLNKIDLLKNEAISSNNSSDIENIKPTLLLTSHALRIHSLDQPDVSEESNEEKNSDSSKRHTRSQSESIAVPFQTEEFLIADNRKESTIQSDKKSVKTILSQLLPSTSANNSIQSPLNSQEHHLLPPGIGIPLVVYENEPSSIIAYALTTVEYRRALDDLLTGKQRTCLSHVNEPSPSPVHKRKHIMSQSDNSISTSEIEESVSSTRTSMVDLNKSQDLSTTDSSKNKSKSSAIVQLTPSSHIEIQFQDSTSNFLCRIYCAEQFASLRKAVLSPCTNLYGNVNKSINEYEERYIRSLSRSVQWAARGGKSGSNFSKTKDDRFILKEMSKLEMQLFLDSASNYFVYMEQCISLSQPTLLGKIVGVYKVIYRNASANTGVRKSFLVMENLFYNRQVTHKFDLKGSDRNRLVNIDAVDQDGEIVLLDENLLKMTCQSPLYILPHSKSVLTTAINNDTNFLASQSVMDYSLLVGLDEDSKELVVGIIDYIRTFTWDKKLETMVKKSGILGGQGKLPTIVSPEEYRKRFIAAMHRYFLPVPGRWIGLSQCIDF